MSGVTKKIFDRELIDINKMLSQELKSIKQILPRYYTDKDIIYLIKYFYPHEWYSIQSKYEYYTTKDKYLKKLKGKKRFKMLRPEAIVKKNGVCKVLLSQKSKEEYSKNYDDETVYNKFRNLEKIRKPKVKRITDKIEKAKQKTQQVTPVFLDKLIGLYERKDTSQKDRLYIILELKKYYNPKIVQFFFKINDTELNKQLRDIAFYHLQSFNYHPRMRKQKYMKVRTKNKKRKEYLEKDYAFQKFEIPLNPNELDYRIKNAPEQSFKFYDFFISHSSKDSRSVQELINHLNMKGINVYCDWISDSDYLKRELVCQETIDVIKSRLDKSNALLFVQSQNSLESKWCKYELNYFSNLDKPLYVINVESISNGNFKWYKLLDDWYIDSDYKKYELI